MTTKTLLVFSVGPVQSFIAQARKLEDLWGGSYLLSYLIETAIAGLFTVSQRNNTAVTLVYPARNDATPASHHAVIEVAALPNRFVAVVDSPRCTAVDMANELEGIVRAEFRRFCLFGVNAVFDGDKVNSRQLLDMTEQQAAAFLEVYWATETIEHDDDYAVQRKQLESHLAASKNNRCFPALPFPDGLACTVCGERTALMENPIAAAAPVGAMKQQVQGTWNKRSRVFAATTNSQGEVLGRIKPREFLCGICLGKRTARDFFKQERDEPHRFNKFESIEDIIGSKSNYYAILMLDGDDMGTWYDNTEASQGHSFGPGSPELNHHQWLSQRLTHFSTQTVPRLVDEVGGRLIYAGGDDVLAFVPLGDMLTLAENLRRSFADPRQGLHQDATASCSLVVVHKTSPLQAALNNVRRLEGKAKEYTNPFTGKRKDALALAVYIRGGEKREVVLPWQHGTRSVLAMLEHLIKLMKEDLSSTFLYTFGEAFLPLLGHDWDRRLTIFPSNPHLDDELMQVELRRLLERTGKESKAKPGKTDYQTLADELVMLHKLVPTTLQFVHLLEIACRLAGSVETGDDTAVEEVR